MILGSNFGILFILSLIIKKSGSFVYIVKSGDLFWLIVNEYKMMVQELKKLNGLSSDMICVGQKLKVVGIVFFSISFSFSIKSSFNKSLSFLFFIGIYKVQFGDLFWKIVNKVNMFIVELKVLNNLKLDIIYVN